MTELTLNLFDTELAATSRRITDLQTQAARLAEQLARTRAELARQEAHRRTLELHRALLLGEHAPLTPGHISSDEDVLGLRVGPLLLCPPGDAGVADLRLHAETMRAVYQQAIHQARLAEDAIAAMTTPAGAPPAAPADAPDAPADEPDGEPDDALDDELAAPGDVDADAGTAAITEPPPQYADLVGRPVIVNWLDGLTHGVLIDATADVLRLDDEGTVREIPIALTHAVSLDVVEDQRRERAALVGRLVDVTTTGGDRVHGVVHSVDGQGLTVGGLTIPHAQIEHVAPAVLPRRERTEPPATPVYAADKATLAAVLDGLNATDTTTTRPDDRTTDEQAPTDDTTETE